MGTNKESKMKKVLCVAMAAFMAAAFVQAEETTEEIGDIGVGYQGFFIGGDLINNLAIRFAPKPYGGQIEIGQVSLDADGGGDIDLFMLKGKGYYKLIERENSDFYVGASLGYLMLEQSGNEVDGFSIAPLMGVEYKLQGLPELGLNFEVSYEIADLDAEGTDVTLNGIGVCAGMSYYF